MSRVGELSARFRALAALERNGVEVVSVDDAAAARFDAITRRVVGQARIDESDVWADLVGTVKSLRWRLITEPAPISLNAQIVDFVEMISKKTRIVRGAVNADPLLDELILAAESLLENDPRLGTVLFESIQELGFDDALVIAPSARSRGVMSLWLAPNDVKVLTLSELQQAAVGGSVAYFVGPPRFYKSAAVTAPRTEEVTFLTPSWFSDKRIPESVFSTYAERPIQIATRVIQVLEPDRAGSAVPDSDLPEFDEEDLLPAPVWGVRQSENRPPNSDEVEAHKVLLSGGFAIWLDDDGDRIRALDPTQPPGERVVYIRVADVDRGVFLLLREGQAERDALHARAVDRIGTRSQEVLASQARWKRRLKQRIDSLGFLQVESRLRASGVRAAGQIRAWCEPFFIRPQSDEDFQRLLKWLDLDIDPFFANATELRLEVLRASRDLREQLEAAADHTNFRLLEINGHQSLALEERGLRGMFVTCVIGVSPFSELISRTETRVPFKDEGGKWLA